MTYLTEEKMTRRKSPISFSICHRYDQALMTILWASQLKYNFTSVHIDSEPEIAMAHLVRSHDNLLDFDDDPDKDGNRPKKVNLSIEQQKLEDEIKTALKVGNEEDSEMVQNLRNRGVRLRLFLKNDGVANDLER